MAIDLKNLLSIVQKKINNLDSSTSTLQELLDVANFTDKASNGTILFVDDSSDLPNLNDETLPTADGARSLVFAKNSGRLFAKMDTWKPFTFRGLIPPPGAFQAQGSTSGYTSGGSTGPETTNTIDKFPFASDANATDVGDLTVAKQGAAGQSSTASGYTSGGPLPGSSDTTIEKFPFASDGNATDVGDLTVGRWFMAGHSSADNGYNSGGASPVLPAPNLETTNTIDKFPFASDGNATDVGDLLSFLRNNAGHSSADNGYSSGHGPTSSNVIQKFPFATDADATDVGDLLTVRQFSAGQSSTDNGYTSGGIPGGTANVIQKFPFASDGNATDVGDLTVGRRQGTGQSSTASGYNSGGGNYPTLYNTIDKFPFASDANATDVGDLTVIRQSLTGQQV